MTAVARIGNATATIAMQRAAVSSRSVSDQARWSSVDCFSTLASAVPRMRGSVTTMVNSENASIGTTTTTHRVTTVRAQGLSIRVSGCFQRHGRTPSRVGLIRWNRSGTPVRSASTWYPSKRTRGVSCRTICRIWVATSSSSASYPVAHHTPATTTATIALK